MQVLTLSTEYNRMPIPITDYILNQNYAYIYIYHFHTLLQREEKMHKCHIALLSVLRNAITRNGDSIY